MTPEHPAPRDPKTKCPCCRFENCLAQFEKYKNHTAFSALGKPVQRIYEFAGAALRGEIKSEEMSAYCDSHGRNFAGWFFDFFEPKAKVLSKGVMLRKIGAVVVRRGEQ